MGKPACCFFQIESDELDQSRLCVWSDDFVVFDPALPVDRVTPWGEALFEDKLTKDGWARLFVMMPHVLHKGVVDVSRSAVVE